ncbi:MAG TPA: hypothetical protein VF796_11340 [Humisphaera sp.]
MSRRDRSNLFPADPATLAAAGAIPVDRAAGDRDPADLSLAARMLDALRRGDDQKSNKVGRLRSAIESHSYENALKLSVAVDRLMERLDGAATA